MDLFRQYNPIFHPMLLIASIRQIIAFRRNHLGRSTENQSEDSRSADRGKSLKSFLPWRDLLHLLSPARVSICYLTETSRKGHREVYWASFPCTWSVSMLSLASSPGQLAQVSLIADDEAIETTQ